MADPIQIDVGNEILEFPAGMSDDEIKAILSQQFPKTEQPKPIQPTSAIPAGVDPDVVGLTDRLGGQAAIDEMYEKSADIRGAQKAVKEQTFTENVVGSLPMAGQMLGSIGGALLTKRPSGMVIGGGTGYGVGENLRQAITGESRVNEMLIGVGLASTTEALAGPISKLLQKGIEITPAILKSFAPQLADSDALKIIGELSKPIFMRGKDKVPKEDTVRLLETLSNESNQAGLTPAQFQQSWVSNLREAFGRAGIGGQEMFDQLKQTNEKVLRDFFQDKIAKLQNGSMTIDEVGESFYNFIQQGNKALGEAYRAEESAFLQGVKNVVVNTSRTKDKVKLFEAEGSSAFLTDATGKPVDTALSNQLLGVMNKIKNIKPNASPKEIDDLVKLLNETQSEASSVLGQTSPTTRKITELINTLRKDLKDSLPTESKAAYEKMKNNYAASKSALFPSALRQAMRYGKKENFEAIGNVLQKDGNTTVVKDAFKALDEAKRLNPKLNTLEAQRAMQGGFLESRLKSGNATIDEMAKYFDDLASNKTKLATFNEMFGESGKGIMMALKAAKDAVEDPVKSGVFSLFVASRQLSGAIQLTGAVGTVGFDPDSIDNMTLVSAGAILLSPYMAARIASNPKTARMLLNLEKNSPKLPARAISSATLQILRELNVDPKIVNEQLMEMGLPSLDYQAPKE